MSNMAGYELNDKDIEAVVQWLLVHRPEKTTKEYAANLLLAMKTNYRQIGFDDPDLLEDLQKDFQVSDQKGNTSDE